MLTFDEYLKKVQEKQDKSGEQALQNRFQELAGLKESSLHNRYAIQIVVQFTDNEFFLEYEQYKQFKKSTDLYSKHPENPNIPVQAHYHVVDVKSKKEIYAVNVDGSAHHRANKRFQVPKKQADELRELGVDIPSNNILESRQLSLNESLSGSSFSFFIIIED